MSDTLTEMSKQYPGGIRQAQAEAWAFRFDYDRKQRDIAKQLEPHILAILGQGEENAIDREQIQIRLEHKISMKWEEWNLRDALGNLMSNHKIQINYKWG